MAQWVDHPGVAGRRPGRDAGRRERGPAPRTAAAVAADNDVLPRLSSLKEEFPVDGRYLVCVARSGAVVGRVGANEGGTERESAAEGTFTRCRRRQGPPAAARTPDGAAAPGGPQGRPGAAAEGPSQGLGPAQSYRPPYTNSPQRPFRARDL